MISCFRWVVLYRWCAVEG